jgi:tetratricopeptide (TPR) repeat protein
VFPLIRNLAHIEAFYLKNIEKAVVLLEDLIQRSANDKVMQAQSKLDLADILLYSGEPWEATLLYSQVDKAFKNDPLGHEARFRNARLSFFIGEFDWARAQLDVLKAATSKLIANDAMQMSLLITDNIEVDSSTVALGSFARAGLLLFRNNVLMADALLDSIKTAFPGHSIIDDVLMKKAEIQLKKGDFTAAESMYTEVIEQYPDDILADDAMFKLATLYEVHLIDLTKASETYQKLMTQYPGSIYVVEARKQFRTLRGDFQQQGQ